MTQNPEVYEMEYRYKYMVYCDRDKGKLNLGKLPVQLRPTVVDQKDTVYEI